jgi:hypothetical protein
VVRLDGEGGTTGGTGKVKLLSTRAPLVRVLTRTAVLDREGGVRLRVACAAPKGTRCLGSLTLRGADGRALATQPISLSGGATSTVRLQLDASPDPAEGDMTGTVVAVGEVPVGRDARTVTRIAVSAR